MTNELKKELQREIAKLIKLPNYYQNELKDVIVDMDNIMGKISKLPDHLKNEAAKMFIISAVNHKLINFYD